MITQGIWTTKRLLRCTVIENETGSRIVHLPDHVEFEGKPCGSIESQDKTQKEIDDNAKLISAAPELLEACKGLLKIPLKIAEYLDIDASESIYGWIIDAQDAIIKAEKI